MSGDSGEICRVPLGIRPIPPGFSWTWMILQLATWSSKDSFCQYWSRFITPLAEIPLLARTSRLVEGWGVMNTTETGNGRTGSRASSGCRTGTGSKCWRWSKAVACSCRAPAYWLSRPREGRRIGRSLWSTGRRTPRRSRGSASNSPPTIRHHHQNKLMSINRRRQRAATHRNFSNFLNELTVSRVDANQRSARLNF